METEVQQKINLSCLARPSEKTEENESHKYSEVPLLIFLQQYHHHIHKELITLISLVYLRDIWKVEIMKDVSELSGNDIQQISKNSTISNFMTCGNKTGCLKFYNSNSHKSYPRPGILFDK